MAGRGDDDAGTPAHYRPELDGMRALAVYLVVAFHAGIGHLRNGFIGVDVFFVLSGYLVTTLLLRDLDGEGGRIRFGWFYARRARRLLPAAAVNLIVTAVVFGAIAPSIELPDARSGIQAASLYYANWHFIQQSSDYFAADIATNPVIQYWSLSVEEQFYLAWPLLITGIFLLARRARTGSRRIVQVVVALAAVASAALALSLVEEQLDRAYMGTFSRAYQLLAGALLALAPGAIRRVSRSRARPAMPVLAAAAALGLVVLATGAVDTDPIRRGILTAATTVALLVALTASARGPVRAALSWTPVTYLGKVSYGTYIWHWLVIVVLAREVELAAPATAVVTAVVATGIASLSYQLLEHPLRASAFLDRRRPIVLSCAVVLSLLVGLVVAPAVLDRSTIRVRPQGTGFAAASTGTDAPFTDAMLQQAVDANFRYGSCPTDGSDTCTRTTGSGRTAIVVGESHAGMWTPMLERVARRRDLTLLGGYLSFCPWTKGIMYASVAPNCLEDQRRMFDETIPRLDPDIVFLTHRAIDDPLDPQDIVDADAGLLRAGAKGREPALRRRITDLVHRLRRQGRTVVLIEPTPVSAQDRVPLQCLAFSKEPDACRFVATPGPLGEEQIYRDLAKEDPGVISLDLDPLVCPYLPICDPIVDGKVVLRDNNHLTTTYSASLADRVDWALSVKGLFPRR